MALLSPEERAARKLAGAFNSGKLSTLRAVKNREDYAKEAKYCKLCETMLPFERRKDTFCSKRCGYRYYSLYPEKKKKAKPGPAPSMPRYFCVDCGSRTYNESGICRIHVKERAIVAGLVPERGTLKRWLASKRGWACEMCLGTEWLGQKIPLELDHIDGNAGNNFPTNLRLLCPNCHALTPTAKGRNRGNGRKARGVKIV